MHYFLILKQFFYKVGEGIHLTSGCQLLLRHLSFKFLSFAKSNEF